jgi:hypothetical protein
VGGSGLAGHGGRAGADPWRLAAFAVGPGGASPVGERPDDGLEGAPLFGQAVFDSRRDLGIADPLDQPVLLQVAQPVGEGLGADPGQRGAQFGEPPGAGEQVADHQHGPLPVQHTYRPRHRAGLLGASISHHVIPGQVQYFKF